MKLRASALTVAFCGVLLYGCVAAPDPAAFFEPLSLEQRQLQTRVFASSDEVNILKACSALLLDNGFQIFEAESRLGWMATGKLKFSPDYMMISNAGIAVYVYPAPGRPGNTAVRLTVSGVYDPEIYRQMFLRLSQRLFLEEQPL